ncbi:MAG: DUF4249 family protein [Ignavibacterium sp.]|nr:MAG: DUF4249 family protein [Ignavibacterium sp.]
MKLLKTIIALAVFLLLASCGDPQVDITGVGYQSKIAVQGYVYPNEEIKNIRITRNFPLETMINPEDLILTPSKNSVEIKVNGIALQFDVHTQTYYTNAITANFGETYLLEVSAIIDGEQLQTTSATTVPLEGFSLLTKDLGTVIYRTPIEFQFTPSPGTDFYAFSIIPDSASVDNFIYDNPYFPNLERQDVEDDLNSFRFQFDLVINVESSPGSIREYEILGLDTWFYSTYQVIVYAGDKNFKDYVLTASNVQQFDGNFIDPRMYFDGDGIGVFGSAIRDTLTFNLVAPSE